MNHTELKNFAQKSRVDLINQVGGKLKLILSEDSLERREHPGAIFNLEKEIQQKGKERVIEEVAYTWFNRFCALRFMDVNNYNFVKIVSPRENEIHPEILVEARNGIVDEKVVSQDKKEKVLDLLSGRLQSKDAQSEVYQILLTSYCNSLNKSLPFLFKEITDYTELLLPTGLLSSTSVLAECRKALTEESCKDVEVIGWLYQYYISEKKDNLFKDFRKGKKAEAKDIPAATQLFTPHWIVQYLVENSLGRLWMLNNPKSNLVDKMEYYIATEQEEEDYLKISSPEDIKVLDPACGSGHMLTYAFDLLYAIYEEAGYSPPSIPSLILKHNLYGIEIDRRAAELASFALVMKARRKDNRFLDSNVEPNVITLEPITIDADDLKEYVKVVGDDLFSSEVLTTLEQFKEADNFGSLIVPAVKDASGVLQQLKTINTDAGMFVKGAREKVLTILKQAEYLSPRYHVVLANPPYMGAKNMNKRLSDWLKVNYKDVKSDLFSAFIVRNLKLSLPKGQLGFMSPNVWMYLSSYEKLRNQIIKKSSLQNLVELPLTGFKGATVQICAFTLVNNKTKEEGKFISLKEFRGADVEMSLQTKEAIRNPDCGWLYRASADEFKKIPGSPIAYWLSEALLNTFINYRKLSQYVDASIGLITGNNDYYIRTWYETSYNKIGYGYTRKEAKNSAIKWFPYAKGGTYRKWYGNIVDIINWENDGEELLTRLHPSGKRTLAHNFNLDKIFKEGISWTVVTSGPPSFRYIPQGFLFDAAGGVCQSDTSKTLDIVSFLNTKYVEILLKVINPTLNLHPGYIGILPVFNLEEVPYYIPEALINISKSDWDSYETSWDFSSLPLLDDVYRGSTLKDTYSNLRSHWNDMTLEMQRLEEENNRIFIEAYGLEDELTPDVPLDEITLTCNPYYRYRGAKNKTEKQLEKQLLADTIKEFISYSVGCMFGRYSLDKEGLILANQGDTYEKYLSLVPNSSFSAVKYNAIPILDDNWFSDDIVELFRRFIKVTFGEENYDKNLTFVEKALGKNIRDYFVKDFYNDHVRTYKKRPIYWMFSSPDSSFNVLIYLHRYQSDNVSVILNEYLRVFKDKISLEMKHYDAIELDSNASKSNKVKALNESSRLLKISNELEKYEKEIFYPLATRKLEIDLDDGVKVNYPKFGKALKKITGLS